MLTDSSFEIRFMASSGGQVFFEHTTGQEARVAAGAGGTNMGGEPRLLSAPGPTGPPSEQSIHQLGNGMALTM
jgi:hypothetical protein